MPSSPARSCAARVHHLLHPALCADPDRASYQGEARPGRALSRRQSIRPARRAPSRTPTTRPAILSCSPASSSRSHPDFDEPTDVIGSEPHVRRRPLDSAAQPDLLRSDRPVLFVLGRRLFDERVAWMALVIFLFSDFVWKFSLPATPIDLLMFLVTAALLRSGGNLPHRRRTRFDSEELPFWPRLALVPVIAVLLGVICLFCLPLLILSCRSSSISAAANGATGSSFRSSPRSPCGIARRGSFTGTAPADIRFGSNLTLGPSRPGRLRGQPDLLHDRHPQLRAALHGGSAKEYSGFLWYFQRGWDLLGSNPLVLLFAASILHEFRRKRVQAFHWLVVGMRLLPRRRDQSRRCQAGPPRCLEPLRRAAALHDRDWQRVFLHRCSIGCITQLPLLNITIVVGILALCRRADAACLHARPSFSYYNYPPYLPPYISFVSRSRHARRMGDHRHALGDRLVRRPRLALAAGLAGRFRRTSTTTSARAAACFHSGDAGQARDHLTTGEYKEWFPIVDGTAPPATFPFHRYAKLPAGGPEYILLSDNLGPRRARTSGRS